MADMASVAGMLSALKGAKDIATSIIGLRDAELLRATVIKLQEAILAAQSAALDAKEELTQKADEIRSLKRKIEESEAWEAVASRYTLKDYGSNTFAYELGADAAASEPVHKLCVTCFQLKRKSILQHKYRTNSGRLCT